MSEPSKRCSSTSTSKHLVSADRLIGRVRQQASEAGSLGSKTGATVVGAMAEDECVESTLRMLDELDMPGAHSQKSEPAGVIAVLSFGRRLEADGGDRSSDRVARLLAALRNWPTTRFVPSSQETGGRPWWRHGCVSSPYRLGGTTMKKPPPPRRFSYPPFCWPPPPPSRTTTATGAARRRWWPRHPPPKAILNRPTRTSSASICPPPAP